MKEEIENLRREIEAIKARNARVEADKDWETSKTRTAFISLVTFALVYGFSWLTNQESFLNAALAVVAYYISTESYGLIKRWWLKRRRV